MLTIYCIPGLGVDERLFDKLKLENCRIHPIKWLTPFKNETLANYAMRLADQIDQTKPFVLLGVSFGGMCCSEISLKLNPLKTFIVSSCKTSDELPKSLVLLKYTPIYKLMSTTFFIKGALIIKKRFGIVEELNATLFEKMLEAAPKNYFSRALDCIIHWKLTHSSPTIIHIHGDADKILPYKKIKNCNYTIKGGTHWMVMNKAEEISKIINEELIKIGG
jgi:hypothetical protein